MATALPFKGFRPKKDKIKDFHCPPYDVIDREESKKYAEGKPENFIHVTRSDIDIAESIDDHDASVYLKAKQTFEEYVKKGILIQDTEPCYYFYKEEWRDVVQLGLFASVSALEYEKGIIRRHEFTRKEKEIDRTTHIMITQTHTEPVFLTYQGHDIINNTINAYIKKTPHEYQFSDENKVTHTVWICKDKDIIDKIKNEFNTIELLYIADGHHRTASSLNAQKEISKNNKKHTGNEEYNYFMAVIFPSSQLKILPYNRVVKDLNSLSVLDFIAKVKKVATIVENNVKKPIKKHDVCMFINGKWSTLTFNQDLIPTDSVKSLDVDLLQTLVLDPLLGIKDPRTDNRIKFIGGIRGTDELEMLVNKKGFAVAFSMHPTNVNDLIKVASEFKVMPPKSTWFEPKLRSGIVVHSFKN